MINLLRALYGGPAQPEISDPRGIIIRAQEMVKASPDKILNPGQYDNVHVSLVKLVTLILTHS